jgi:putative surface-exposed virulence protein
MKKTTTLGWMSMFMLLGILHSFNISAQTIATYDFESGLMGWTDGGSDSGHNTNSIYAYSGIRSIYTKDDDVAQNLTTSPTLNLAAYSSVDISFGFIGSNLDAGEGFVLEYFNGTTWSTIKTFSFGVDFTSNNTKYMLYATVNSGLVSNARFRFRGTANDDNEYNYFDNVTVKVSAPEIDVTGNNKSIINGDVSPVNSDYTAYGTANFGTLISRIYTIYNRGGASLNISSINLSNTTDFSIISPFYSSPVVASTGSTTFTVRFNPATLGTKTCKITIANNDSDESSFTFDIEARAEQNFFDSDGDGILDNVDIDDDNDGISDYNEELACKNSSVATTTNYKFLNETFGEGNRTTINTTYDAETTYCYEDGTGGVNTLECPDLSTIDLNDGKYTVYHKAADGDGVNDTPNLEVASWADQYWYTGEDHTPGDTNGRMAMFNASYEPGVFYTATIIGALPNIPVTYSFWVLNLDHQAAPGIATRLRPNIRVEFRDVNNNVLASITTGDIPPSINGDPANSWHQFTASVTFTQSEFYVYFINNEVGGSGNDLAIDDIVISQTLCDTDSDGIADIFDLDADNDGIPDVVEAGLGNHSQGKAMLTAVTSWIDANSNGMHDLSEGHIVLDSDNDGVPNYLDLDSDNDGVFDVDESGAGNPGNPTYQNGDGDITGDGVGDGPDTDAVRETDVNSDGILEYFTDGILDIYDFYEGSTFSTAYGNTNQGSTGSGWHHYVRDSDNDGIPDYMDINSDGTTFDISHTLYANLDANNNGIVDDTNDTDGDGIVDLFDTDDNAFGSPRYLDNKFHLYFDGRNDYATDTQILSGLQNVTIMGWIKIDPTFTGYSMVFGQSNLEIQVHNYSQPRIYARANGLQISSNTSTHPIIKDEWYHLALVYDGSNDILKLYLDGEIIASRTGIGSSLNANPYPFTIGKAASTSDNTSYFKGYIDEVRVFNKSLTDNELKKMVYQEVENNSGIIRGRIIPKDITDYDSATNTSTPLPWNSLLRYFRMDTYRDDIIDNLTTASVDVGSGAKIYNVKTIDLQTAPLPHITINSCHGNWDDPINWENGNNPHDTDALIVHLKGNLQNNDDISTVGMILNTGSELEVNGNSQLANSWYLKLDGQIDLEGDSQLIQGMDSTLDPTSSGNLEKDQQGTADKFTYNYWASPVGRTNNSTNNNSYRVTDIFTNVGFNTSGYDGTASPLRIADYWIWKFSNQASNNYSKWQHVRSSGTLLIGEGFTMKGPGTGPISAQQNYILRGKPNNGDINLNINTGNDYLVGNPYASAIDAEQFILDNAPTIAGTGSTTGTLYFWEHWGGGTHILRDYQGGYATYSLSGGVPAAAIGTSDPNVSSAGTPTKIPGRYIPVGQGFFVTAETDGTIKFNNGQRIFQKEDGINSQFIKPGNSKNSKISESKQSDDTRMKFRIGFNSVGTLHRQLLTTVDSRATTGKDWGFDALYIDTQSDDMYWMIENKKYTIQGIDTIDESTILPLGIHTKKNGLNSVVIDKLEHVPSTLKIYLHDKELNVYHDLLESKYEVNLNAGEYLNRFELTFSKSQKTLDVDKAAENNPIDVYFSNERKSIVISNSNSRLIKSVELLNILGQSLFKFDKESNQNNIEYKTNQIQTGAYIVQITTEYGKFSKKILIQ